MTAATASQSSPEVAVMPAGRVWRAYLTEAKFETVRMLRTPAFAVPFLGLPALLYLLFGVVIFGPAAAGDPQTATFIFAAFAVFGVMGPGIFGFGMAVAAEREQGLLTLKRALPMPPAAYLLAKMLMTLIFGVAVMASMVAVAPLGHVPLGAAQAIGLSAINVLGALPMCAIGLFIGTRTTSRSAPAIVNVIYQAMMHVSGLFYPLPRVLRAIAPLWPSYHLQQLDFGVLGVASQSTPLVHVVFLVGLAWLLSALSLRRFARVG